MMTFKTRRTSPFVAFLFAFMALTHSSLLFSQDAESKQLVREFRGRTMGTTYMVKVAGAEAVDDQTLRFSIDAELRRVNDQMSTYLESSEISTFNQSDSIDWFSVSSEFAEVVAAAQKIAEDTNGALDVTVAPLVNAWSFGTTERSHTIPSAETIQTLLKSVGFKKLDVRLEPPALRKAIAELQIDLSSIAKGHGVDRVVDKLAQLGADNVFVEIGGEVRTSGEKTEGPWKVGIQLPDAASDTVMIAHPMKISDTAGNAMATSGDYRNLFVVDGQRYSHTIDPRSGSPIRHNLASVTVIAQTCMEADGWATALNVLGADAGFELANRNHLDVLLVSRGSEKQFEMVGTGILAQYAVATADSSSAPVPVATNAPHWLSAVVPIAILTFGVFSILLFAMAIGVVFGRRTISGSCGGLASKTNEDGSTSCSLCSNPSDACKELREKMTQKPSST